LANQLIIAHDVADPRLKNGFQTGVFRSYFESGQLNEVYTTSKGRIVGLYISYFTNGNTKVIGEYKDIVCNDEFEYKRDTITLIDPITYDKILKIVSTPASSKTGKWYFFNSNGQLIKEEMY